MMLILLLSELLVRCKALSGQYSLSGVHKRNTEFPLAVAFPDSYLADNTQTKDSLNATLEHHVIEDYLPFFLYETPLNTLLTAGSLLEAHVGRTPNETGVNT